MILLLLVSALPRQSGRCWPGVRDVRLLTSSSERVFRGMRSPWHPSSSSLSLYWSQADLGGP